MSKDPQGSGNALERDGWPKKNGERLSQRGAFHTFLCSKWAHDGKLRVVHGLLIPVEEVPVRWAAHTSGTNPRLREFQTHGKQKCGKECLASPHHVACMREEKARAPAGSESFLKEHMEFPIASRLLVVEGKPRKRCCRPSLRRC